MNGIIAVVKEAATSKKFIATLAGTITAAALKIGLDLPTEDVATVLSPIVIYILAQGWSDRGKEAAKVTAVAEAASTGGMVTQDTIDTIKNT